MRYNWDVGKARANLVRHQVEFTTAIDFDWDTAVETLDDRFDYGEDRWIALGFIGPLLYVMVYVYRVDEIRIISLRKANRREREYYATQT